MTASADLCMNEDESDDDSLRENTAAMGQSLGELFTILSEELLFAHWRWQEYVDLGNTESRLDLMNASAPFFFWVVQRTLFFDTLLGITKLTAPPTSGRRGQENLTVRQLPALLKPSLKDRVSARCEQIAQKAKFAKTWRDKLIAHHDLKLALRKAKPLPAADRVQIDAVLGDLANILNEVREAYSLSTYHYPRVQSTGGARELLFYVRDGLRCDERRTEMLERGEYDPTWWHADLPDI